jgi:hypothetical protein
MLKQRAAGIVLGAFMVLTALLRSAHASPPRRGADALDGFFRSINGSRCLFSFGYHGGGSTGAERGLLGLADDPFQVALMTRAPRASSSTLGVCAHGATAESIRLGMDGISVMTAASEVAACAGGLTHQGAITIAVAASGHACPGCAGSTYTFSSWQQVLQLLYGGQHNDPAGTIDCGSAVRRAVAEQWGLLFQGGCTGSTCSSLRRLWRPSDLSGTSDDLLRMVGLPAMPFMPAVPGATPAANPYCNARAAGPTFGGDGDYLDLDPIRRPCAGSGHDGGDQVCGRDGTLGLVLPVYVPPALLPDSLYPQAPCDVGKFRLLLPGPGITVCPNGKGLLFGKCFQPIRELPNGQISAACLARKFPVHLWFGAGDGRVHNLVAKHDSGMYRRDLEGRLVTGAYYRNHTTTSPTGVTCREPTAARQLGCLLAASKCSLAFAARNAWQGRPAIAPLAVNGILPDREAIQRFAAPDESGPVYPLTRYLYANTLQGFEGSASFPDGDGAMYHCLSDPASVNPALEANNFVPLPDGPRCQDFDEVTSCGAAVNVNACLNNPPPVFRP